MRQNSPSLALFGLGLFILLLSPLSLSGQSRSFELSDLGKIVDLGDPQISPDGSSLVLVASRPDYEENRFESELILVKLPSGDQQVLTYERPGVRHPRWSPDGESIAFLAADAEKKPQIFELSMAGGEARPVTQSPTGVLTFAWRPDGKAIAYVAVDEREELEGEERHNRSFEVGDNSFLTTAEPLPAHIWLVEPGRLNESTRLTQGMNGVSKFVPSPLAWSPDGSNIGYISQMKPHSGYRNRATIRLLDVSSGESRELVSTLSYYQNLAFSGDGTQLMFLAPEEPGSHWYPYHVFAHSIFDKQEICLSHKVDRKFRDFRSTPDGQSVLASAFDHTRQLLWRFGINGASRKIDLGDVDVMEYAAAPDGSVVIVGVTPDQPEELYYLAALGEAPKRLSTFNNWADSLSFGKVEQVVWNGPDEFKESGVLVYPVDYVKGKQYPLVLFIHGGPSFTSIEGFYIWFGQLQQLMAAEGWLVFCPNYRGSDNQGREYQTAVIGDGGDGPGRDVMAGLEAVKAKGIVDEERIALSGWSYGGYMTTWLMGHYEGWASAVAGAAVTDAADGYNLSDINVAIGHKFSGSPWNEEYSKEWVDQSPITYWKNMKTPTLIMSNTGDERVPITESYKLYRALKEEGVEVQFIAYPFPGHHPPDPVNKRDRLRRWVNWIRDHF